MKTKTSTLPLTVLAFDNPTQAYQLQEALVKLQGESVHDFQDAVVVTRNAKGKVKVHSAINAVTGCAVAGSMAGFCMGTIFLLGFPGSVVGGGSHRWCAQESGLQRSIQEGTGRGPETRYIRFGGHRDGGPR
jgi:uncharacterized membrane protein